MPQMKPLMWMFMMPLSVMVLLLFFLMIFYLQFMFPILIFKNYKYTKKINWLW